jgi:hypothetical protein
MHHITIQRRRRAILGEQHNLFIGLPARVERFDRLAPCSALAVVDLAQIQHVPLHRPPAGDTAVLDDAPIAVLLAVLVAKFVAQKHGASLPEPPAVSQGAWSAPQPLSADTYRLTPHFSSSYRHPEAAKFPKQRSSCESRASHSFTRCFDVFAVLLGGVQLFLKLVP